jgi:pimeloyl-ACP methyl ester carboxylesterase
LTGAAKLTRRTVPVDGGALEVLVAGPDGEGARTLCTAHPYASMDAALPLLARLMGCRVVSVNLRGVGGSRPPERSADATLERMADDLDDVRGALGIPRWVLWGMSGGSMIGQVAVHRHPEALDALVLDSAGPCFRETLRDPDCSGSPFAPRWRAALAVAGLTPDPLARAPDVGAWDELPGAGWVCRSRSGTALLVSPTVPTALERRVMPSLLAYDARPWLARVRVPVLVLAGAEDRVAPLEQVRALHEAIPRSRLEVIAGAGHVPVGDRPAEVGAAVSRFLSTLPARARRKVAG